jgi:hypothetical protein
LYRTLLGNLCILMYGEIKIKIKFFSTWGWKCFWSTN